MGRPARYRPADTFITINDGDPFLTPIDIPQPEPPDPDLIEGYGLDPCDQVFRRPKIPEALVKIGQDFKNIDDKWEALENQRHNLKKEIEWLKRQVFYHVHGAWWYINGKPTYLPPSFYDSVAFYRTHTGLVPVFRERSRRLHIVIDWANNYTFDFKNKEYDAQGMRLPNKRGDELVDLGERTLMGVIYPKGRRLSATYNGVCWVLNRLHNTGVENYFGLQAQDGAHGKQLWDKFTNVWRTVPWFLMPYYEAGSDPQSQIKYRRNEQFRGDYGLGNHIDYAKNGSSGAYDGEELTCYMRDEIGKVIEERISIEWPRVQKTLAWSEGKVINGFAYLCSTAGEYSKKGGKEFLEMIKGSNYYQRTESGRTETGLITYWEGSHYGSPGFIDRFGDSLHESAKKHYLGERQHLIQQNTPESLKRYREVCRNAPIYLMDSFMREESGIGFDQIILDKRINELSFRKPPPRYNFEWSHGFGSSVVPVENPMGRFINPLILPVEKANRKYFLNGQFYPAEPLFAMHCTDVFNYNETEGRRKSKAAIIGIKRRIDYAEDPDEDIKQWKTPDILYTYSNRPGTVDEVCEDALKANIYYGGLQNPESNNPYCRQYYKKYNYGGYLFYFREEDGSFRSTPGYTKTGNTGNIIITYATKYIDKHGHRTNHIELLKECKEFGGIEDITNLDLVAAFGGALYGIESDYRSGEIPRSSGVTYRQLFGWS
jgi:hypothetical protein